MFMFTRLPFAVCRSATWYDGCRYPDRVIAIKPVSRGTMDVRIQPELAMKPVSRGTMDVPHPDKVIAIKPVSRGTMDVPHPDS